MDDRGRMMTYVLYHAPDLRELTSEEIDDFEFDIRTSFASDAAAGGRLALEFRSQ